MKARVVLDTNVVVSALRSRRGASFRLMSELDSGRFEVCVSVPLVVEYEAALMRQARTLGLSRREIGDFLDYFCSVARRQAIFFLWRPRLRDPGDDMVLEAAVAGGCGYIVTFNQRDFEPGVHLGVRAVTPQTFLRKIGVIE
ncbi:MAG TPA: putative toxin-antitoxin system toxin component, PIN family [Candidatus Krumholzibacteria bacterium]